jgi:hypothetical protein
MQSQNYRINTLTREDALLSGGGGGRSAARDHQE